MQSLLIFHSLCMTMEEKVRPTANTAAASAATGGTTGHPGDAGNPNQPGPHGIQLANISPNMVNTGTPTPALVVQPAANFGSAPGNAPANGPTPARPPPANPDVAEALACAQSFQSADPQLRTELETFLAEGRSANSNTNVDIDGDDTEISSGGPTVVGKKHPTPQLFVENQARKKAADQKQKEKAPSS